MHYVLITDTKYEICKTRLGGKAIYPAVDYENVHKRVTVKPVCNDHLYNKIYYLWFIQ